MNEILQDEGASEAPRLNSGTLVRVPETSMLPDRENAASTSAERDLGESDAAVEGAWHATSRPSRGTREEWVAGARTAVRSSPLACIAAAVAVGAVIARIGR